MSLRKTINLWLQGTAYHLRKMNPALNNKTTTHIKVNIEYFLAKIMLEQDNFFFVQIGANDGMRADDSYGFITRHNLVGIVVEPLHDMFEKLSENYADHPQIQKINKAIHSTAKKMPLYRIKNDANVPDWCHGIASFNKQHLLNGSRKIPDLERYIVEESVDCISLAELFEQTDTKQISFLQIDTEGYDFEIIKMIDFTITKPLIIRYECCTLSKQDNQACIALLANQGYSFFDEGNDIIAVLEQTS